MVGFEGLCGSGNPPCTAAREPLQRSRFESPDGVSMRFPSYSNAYCPSSGKGFPGGLWRTESRRREGSGDLKPGNLKGVFLFLQWGFLLYLWRVSADI